MIVYRGGCHCGNLEVRFATVKTPIELGARADGCTFCAMHRAVYTTDPAGTLVLAVADAARLERYRFGTRTADFLICRTCGVFVAATMPDDKLGVLNINVLEARAEFLALPVVTLDLDAETVEQRLARRRARWTPLT